MSSEQPAFRKMRRSSKKKEGATHGHPQPTRAAKSAETIEISASFLERLNNWRTHSSIVRRYAEGAMPAYIAPWDMAGEREVGRFMTTYPHFHKARLTMLGYCG